MDALLEQGLTMIHLDPRRPGVDVPASLAAGPSLRLNMSYKFHIPDFTVDDVGIVCSLHFPDVGTHRCVIPWDALYGATSQVSRDGRMWMESMPVEIRLDLARRAVMLLGQMHQAASGAPAPEEASPTSPAAAPGPSLRVIDGGAAPPPAEAEGGDDGPEPPPAPRKRPSLRLVK